MTDWIYLVGRARGRAHLWDGEDTVCRMWSTGGLRTGKYQPTTDRGGRKVCQNCQSAADHMQRLETELSIFDNHLSSIFE